MTFTQTGSIPLICYSYGLNKVNFLSHHKNSVNDNVGRDRNNYISELAAQRRQHKSSHRASVAANLAGAITYVYHLQAKYLYVYIYIRSIHTDNDDKMKKIIKYLVLIKLNRSYILRILSNLNYSEISCKRIDDTN